MQTQAIIYIRKIIRINGILTSVILSIALMLCFALVSCSTSGMTPEQRMDTIGELQGQQMERLAALEDNFRNISGKVEELQFEMERKFARELNNVKSSMAAVENRLPPPEIVPNEILLADLVYTKEMENSSSNVFNQALTNIKTGKFSEALKIMNEIQIEAGSPFEFRVIFWQGIATEGLYEYRDAMGYYNRLLQAYPKVDRSAVALYRLVKLFQKIGDPQMAGLTYKKLESEFPNSNYTRKAKQGL